MLSLVELPIILLVLLISIAPLAIAIVLGIKLIKALNIYISEHSDRSGKDANPQHLSQQ